MKQKVDRILLIVAWVFALEAWALKSASCAIIGVVLFVACQIVYVTWTPQSATEQPTEGSAE